MKTREFVPIPSRKRVCQEIADFICRHSREKRGTQVRDNWPWVPAFAGWLELSAGLRVEDWES